jgi:hypothetical protein
MKKSGVAIAKWSTPRGLVRAGAARVIRLG